MQKSHRSSLAISAGDAYQLELARRVSVEVGHHKAQCLTAVLHLHKRHLLISLFPLSTFLTHHRHSALLHSLADEVMPVDLRTPLGHKESPFGHLTRIELDIFHLQLDIADDLAVNTFYYIF